MFVPRRVIFFTWVAQPPTSSVYSFFGCPSEVINRNPKEPVWAIGTGVVATPLQAQDTQYQALVESGKERWAQKAVNKWSFNPLLLVS